MEKNANWEPQKTEEKIAAARRENDRQFEEQADVRNENRDFVKKVFGVGKVGGIDIAHEEALRVNRLVDQKNERESGETSAQTAADEILRSSEFGRKDEATIKAEEFLRAKNPSIAKNIQGGDIASARAAFEKMSEKIKDRNEKQSLRKGLEKIISDQVDTLVQSSDVHGMKKIILENRFEDLGITNIATMPEEVTSLPEVQAKFVGKIKQEFGAKAGYLQNAVHWAKSFTEAGLMKPEAVQELFASEEMQTRMTGRIKQEFGAKAGYPQNAVRWAKSFTEAGLMKPEAVQELFASPELQDRMKNKIKTEFGARGDYPNDAKKWAQQYVALGLMKKEDVEQFLTEIGVK